MTKLKRSERAARAVSAKVKQPEGVKAVVRSATDRVSAKASVDFRRTVRE